MPKLARQKSHARQLNYRRSIESIKSNDTETFSSEDEKILFHPGGDIDDINFSNGSVLNDISDILTFCKEQINPRFISVLLYMSLRHLGHTWRDVDSFLTSIGGTTIKTCHKWTNILVNKDFDEFTIDERVRSVESCRLDLRRFSVKFTANSSRPYFLRHERQDVVKHRQEFVKYFIEREQHFYTITNDAVPQWRIPTTAPTILLCHDESTYKCGEITAKRWIMPDNAPVRVSLFLSPIDLGKRADDLYARTLFSNINQNFT
ncbi:unnamed protein product [Rotaria socialis]